MSNFKVVSKLEFDASVQDSFFLVDLTDIKSKNNVYKVFTIGNLNYGIAYDLDRVVYDEDLHSKFLKRSSCLVFVIHEYAYAISTITGKILFTLGLHDSILAIEVVKYGFVIITESSITRVNDLNKFNISQFSILAEIILDYSLVNDFLILNCLDGENIKMKMKLVDQPGKKA